MKSIISIFTSIFVITVLISFPHESRASQCLIDGVGQEQAMSAEMRDKNVLGNPLQTCCNHPKTGFYRNGFCQTGELDSGSHVVCAVVTDEFLEFTHSKGNDLITPRVEYDFPGLKANDKWCLCANRWVEAYEAGVAPKLVLESTHEKMLQFVSLETLKSNSYIEAQKKSAPETIEPSMTPAGAYMFSFTSIDGEPMPLSDYAGKVILIVNTASQCGFTEQYKDLQMLYKRYKDRGFIVIGVPCNQFGRQEPGSEEVIKDFVANKFGITFPLTSKTQVSGKDAHPFFVWASDQKKGAFLQSSPKWNFHKFLIDRRGRLIKSFGSHINPRSSTMTSEIETLLDEKL